MKYLGGFIRITSFSNSSSTVKEGDQQSIAEKKQEKEMKKKTEEKAIYTYQRGIEMGGFRRISLFKNQNRVSLLRGGFEF